MAKTTASMLLTSVLEVCVFPVWKQGSHLKKKRVVGGYVWKEMDNILP